MQKSTLLAIKKLSSADQVILYAHYISDVLRLLYYFNGGNQTYYCVFIPSTDAPKCIQCKHAYGVIPHLSR